MVFVEEMSDAYVDAVETTYAISGDKAEKFAEALLKRALDGGLVVVMYGGVIEVFKEMSGYEMNTLLNMAVQDAEKEQENGTL